MEPNDQRVLDGVRVLDLTHPYGQYCGRLLADLGADVIKIEPPEGDPARRLGPFKDDQPGADTSLFFANYNTNKRSLALDLASADGREIFRQLVKGADAVVHTPRHLSFAGLAISYEALRDLNPKIIVAEIDGFAEGGPYSDYRSTPQVVFALSGIMKNIGPPEGPPEAAPGQIVFDLTAVDAASGVVCALLSGQGQQITVAAQEVLASEVNPRAPEQFDPRRHPHSSNPQLAPSGAYECQDGQVTFFTNLPGHWEGLKELLGNPPEISGPEWNDRTHRQLHSQFLDELLLKNLSTRTQSDIVTAGQRAHVPCGPVNTVAKFANDPHAAARGFFVPASSPALGDYRMAGAPYKMSEAGWSLRRPAPTLGQHTREILQTELGYAAAEVERLKQSGVVAVGGNA
jgi:crotonobetainyl-CoA:carnitine CoA-transferase CaiB-like acyl-CoA transferase